MRSERMPRSGVARRRVNRGTAMAAPISCGLMPRAVSQMGKNGMYTPREKKSVP